jgi:AraC-like DNA-binding protein
MTDFPNKSMKSVNSGKNREIAPAASTPARPWLCGKLQKRLLQRVLGKMNADLATDLDLSTLAAESGHSRDHFLRTFRAAMGCSPHQIVGARPSYYRRSHNPIVQKGSLFAGVALRCDYFNQKEPRRGRAVVDVQLAMGASNETVTAASEAATE